jgi:ABC-type Na+ efflux pump permease subunit
MVRKDLLRQVRSPLGVLFVLAFPLIFSGRLALAFGGGDSSFPKAELLIEDLDDSLVSGVLLSAAESDQLGEYFDVRQVGTEGRELIEGGEGSALLRIPLGFGADLLAGRPTALELVRNPAQSILPEIAEQALAVLVDALDAGSRVLRDPLQQLSAALENETDVPTLAQVTALSTAFYEAIGDSVDFLSPPVITLESIQLENRQEPEEADDLPQGRAIFVMVLPGIAVWALFMLGDFAMRDVLVEGDSGTLRRQLCTPTTVRELVVAKASYTALLATISLMLLAGIGWVVAGRAVDPIGFLLLSVALVLAITGFASIMYGFARTERQGSTLSSVLLLLFAFMGGSFIQIESLPGAMQRLAPLSPFYWGTTGYRTLVQGGSLQEVLGNAAILAGIGLPLLLAGAALLRRKVAAGGVA